jgi:hypothetical protein
VIDQVLYHGGVPGLWRGDEILPDMAEHRYVAGCAHCEAQRRGSDTMIDPATPSGWVYATSDREYARYYASRAVGGTLYLVRMIGEVEPSAEDFFPTWRARRAVVIRVPERGVTLTMAERRRLFIRWGGNVKEFEEMVAGVVRAKLGPRP